MLNQVNTLYNDGILTKSWSFWSLIGKFGFKMINKFNQQRWRQHITISFTSAAIDISTYCDSYEKNFVLFHLLCFATLLSSFDCDSLNCFRLFLLRLNISISFKSWSWNYDANSRISPNKVLKTINIITCKSRLLLLCYHPTKAWPAEICCCCGVDAKFDSKAVGWRNANFRKNAYFGNFRGREAI